jgi:WD40 repeat protein
METRQAVVSLKGHALPVVCVAVSPDGKRIVSGGWNWSDPASHHPGELKVWDMETGKEVFSLKGHASSVTCLAISPDGRRIASGGGNPRALHSRGRGELKLWDLEKGQEVLSLDGQLGPVSCVLFSPDGKRVVTGGWDTTLKVWDGSWQN